MEELESTGKCLFCEKTFSKAGITRHLSTHLVQKSKTGKPGLSFHIKAETNPRWGSGPYFLNLWVDGEALMDDMDDFLRHIWLECCEHMSGFTNAKRTNSNRGFNLFAAMELLQKGDQKAYEKMMEESSGEIPMSRKTGKALYKDMKLKYDYDYGSTTSLQLTVAGEYPVKADEPIVLLSRNEPLKNQLHYYALPAAIIQKNGYFVTHALKSMQRNAASLMNIHRCR